MIQLTQHTAATPYLPEELRGLRVVHLSDLHRSRLTPDRLLRHAVAMANASCPDIILLTGDFVTDDPADIEPCAQILAHLQARIGIYATLGNHDYKAGAAAMTQALTRRGIHVLLNRSVCVEESLYIVGLDDDRCGRPNIARAFSDVKPERPALVLVHNPGYADRLADRSCLLFAGHTHGGQIRVPFLTRRRVRSIGAKHYLSGWYTVGDARLYVNRGVGQVGLPLRLFCRSEIALFTLQP